MLREKLIERGLAAASLLSDETFQNVIQELCYEQFCIFQETKPEDAEKREQSYYLYQGLKAIEAELLTRVQSKDREVEAMDAERENEISDDPITIQGDNDR